MRNLLQEFHEDHGVRPPTILGVREHIFTGRLNKLAFLKYFIRILPHIRINNISFCSVSSLAWFMSNQETSFVTIGQRVLARPLKYVSLYIAPFTLFNKKLKKRYTVMKRNSFLA